MQILAELQATEEETHYSKNILADLMAPSAQQCHSFHLKS